VATETIVAILASAAAALATVAMSAPRRDETPQDDVTDRRGVTDRRDGGRAARVGGEDRRAAPARFGEFGTWLGPIPAAPRRSCRDRVSEQMSNGPVVRSSQAQQPRGRWLKRFDDVRSVEE
jgi:hypothetical protein